MHKNTNKLLTNLEIAMDGEFPLFKSNGERLRYMKEAYSNMSIAKAFSIFYGTELSNEIKSNKTINQVTLIELGELYTGEVKELTKTHISFYIPGVKEEIICRENFASCIDQIEAYLLAHNNKLLFEVREKRDNAYIVSVIRGYYRSWTNYIKKCMQTRAGIEVHIDELVQGGYVCHTTIDPLNELTGKNYTHSVFIPGSQIVLNIERDFEQWVGKDVTIVPQKFVEFRKNFRTGETENSLVGSRKKILQMKGERNLQDMYSIYLLSQKENVTYESNSYTGVVTGVINSTKKTGIFVELDDMCITGLMPVDVSEVLDYKPGDRITVKIKEFEVQNGKEPFVYNKKGNIIECNTRPVFELA